MPADLCPAACAQLDLIGAIRVERALSGADLRRLMEWTRQLYRGRPGERIGDVKSLDWLLREGAAGAIARAALGTRAQPVRALLFDKNLANNWALGWHQDRTIAVEKRVETAGFHNWNLKAGVQHVEPPFGLIERMVTFRIHLDAVDNDNAPLLIAPGSHRLGRIVEADIEAVVDQCGKLASLAERGDIWVYRTAILHASKRSQVNRQRRVLQVDFSADALPHPLTWAV